jgi:hypothetical protein
MATAMTLRMEGCMASTYSDHTATSNVLVHATQGWLELFLMTPEKFKFGHWKEEIRDKSMVGYQSRPFFAYLVQFVPPTIALNVLALFELATQ